MNRCYRNTVTLFVLLIFAMMWTSSARADFLYTFSGQDNLGGIPDNTFSFTEPSLITTTGAFATSFSIGTVTFMSGFFDASKDCFSFNNTDARDCSLSPGGSSFVGQFPGAVTVGTFALDGIIQCHTDFALVCEDLTSLTISSTTATPEPSGILLFGSGMLGLAGVVRRRWK